MLYAPSNLKLPFNRQKCTKIWSATNVYRDYAISTAEA